MLVGIDVGTTGTKTVLFDGSKVVASHYVEYNIESPKNGYAEQNPEWWWKSAKEGLKKLSKYGKEIDAIGISGQMHGVTIINREGQPVSNSIIWADQRSIRECEELKERFGKEIKNPITPTFSLPQLMWIKREKERIFKKVYKFLLPKDYVKYKLTDSITTDPSDASGTLMYDVEKLKWNYEIIEELDIPTAILPEVFSSSSIVGEVKKEVARECGLKANIPVCSGGADQACGAIGAGIFEEGRISSVIGTAGVILSHSDKPIYDEKKRVFTFAHILEKQWFIMGVMQSAGLSLKWLRERFLSNKADAYGFLDNIASRQPLGAENTIFLPYLFGERTPYWDPHLRGAIVGISYKTSIGTIARAIMEGVVFGLYESLKIIEEMGIKVKDVVALGGGAKSRLWRKIMADIFFRDVLSPTLKECTSFGASLLAGLSVDTFSDISDIIKIIGYEEKISPDITVHNRYMRYYELYKKTSQSLKEIFHEMSKL